MLSPQYRPFTTLIVRDAHKCVAHDGGKETLMKIRTRFWVVKGWSMVKVLIHHCVLCRMFEGALFQGLPPPSPLPDFRLRQSPPFTYTGVDYAGPLRIRSLGLNSSRKVWISIFTFLVTMQYTWSQSQTRQLKMFIRCLRQFTAKRDFHCCLYLTMGKLSCVQGTSSAGPPLKIRS